MQNGEGLAAPRLPLLCGFGERLDREPVFTELRILNIGYAGRSDIQLDRNRNTFVQVDFVARDGELKTQRVLAARGLGMLLSRRGRSARRRGWWLGGRNRDGQRIGVILPPLMFHGKWDPE